MPEEKKNDKRDPDSLLQQIQKEARGKLTVFLGPAAGVGKTYAMLVAAHERLEIGSDIVIGWIETHGRRETEELTEGLPAIPPKEIPYKGKTLKEMDIDAILARKPQTVLVDEMAHTNVPGSRHVRRYQDIEELLEAGINVYTTINIQHIESLNDIVEQITGVKVRETVPDYMLEVADQIRLVDISPEELIQRLKEGKVYVPQQAERALHNFFRAGNINALRELALRRTADRVDKYLHEYMKSHDIQGPWPAAERVMVCISPSPFSAQLVRAARRLSSGMQAEWFAVYIENPRVLLSEEERCRLAKHLQLAEELGAKTIMTTGRDVAEELIDLAHNHHVTQIVIGKPLHSTLREWLYGSVVDRLIRRAEGISVHVIPGKSSPKAAAGNKVLPPLGKINWVHYAGSMLMLAVTTGINLWFKTELENVNIVLLYLLPVLCSALWWGVGPTIATSLAGVVLFDYLFVPPVFSFTIADIRYAFSFLIFVIVGLVVSRQAERLRQQVLQARKREGRMRTLYELSREIAAVSGMETIVRVVVRRAVESFNREVIILLPDSSGQLLQWARQGPKAHTQPASELENIGIIATSGEITVYKQPLEDVNEQAVAIWVMEHGEPAGRGTETLPGAKFTYLPLKSEQKIMGVLGVDMSEKYISPEFRQLWEAFAGLAAIAIERAKLAEQAKQAALLAESDKLRTALFNSISHELRTPLSSIIGAISGLLDDKIAASPGARAALSETVKDGAARMERLISNLLDTARLESGMMQLKNDWCDISDIIGSALRRLGETVQGTPLQVEVPDHAALVWADCVLLEQVFVNLIDNAIKYSPKGSPLDIKASFSTANVTVSVADRGPGIPEGDLQRVFDKFYRLKSPRNVSGTGLGLAICKGIIEAHGGLIWAENRMGGGTIMVMQIPLGKTQPILDAEGKHKAGDS
jgi:two-component system sensor histidine kinase KdpD